MRHALISLAILFITGVATGQRPSSREPVELAAASKCPKPETADPSGVYSGRVSGFITTGFTTGSFNFGDWSFLVSAVYCPDCQPGQYVLTLSYRGMTYSLNGSLVQENGVGGGTLNPDTGVVNFQFFGINCDDLQHKFLTYHRSDPALVKGLYEGGHAGEDPGQRIEVTPDQTRDRTQIPGRISGRISGRDCLDQSLYADINLQKQP